VADDVKKGKGFNYVMKLESRVEGPWSDKDPVPLVEPRQSREYTTLLPWQQFIWESMTEWQPRVINYLYCPTGNVGKSILCMKALCAGRGRLLPPVNDYKDIMRMVCGLQSAKPSGCYMIDVPRSLPKGKLNGFWAGIESLKDGYCWDDRYEFKEMVFDSPVIWVFSNEYPDMEALSKDRWNFWHLEEGEMKMGLSSLDDAIASKKRKRSEEVE
jgi:hypothetical protein